MINDDILIKYSYSHDFGGHQDWVSHVKELSRQIRDIRDNDFFGIGLGDLSLIAPEDVKVGKRIILCDYLDLNMGHTGNASILGLVTKINPDNPMIIELEIEGFGRRPDFLRDPDRKLKWGSLIYPDLSQYPVLLEMITKPKSDGGAVYYYYNKSPRDLRTNYFPGYLKESRSAILGTLRNTSSEDLSGVRPRAQYLHTYRRVAKEIRSLLKETRVKDKILSDLYEIIKDATYEKSKEISRRVWEITKE